MPPLDDGGPPSTEALLSVDARPGAAAIDESVANATELRAPPGSSRPDDRRPRRPGDATPATGGASSSCVSIESRRSPPSRCARRSSRGSGASCRSSSGTRTARSTCSSTRASSIPKRATVLEALRDAYEASGRAAPIDPAEYAKAFAAHRRAGQADEALLDAMLLEELGVAEPEHLALVEQSRSVGPMQAVKPLDAAAWEALRAPGFDAALGDLFAAIRDAAIAARLEHAAGPARQARSRSPARRREHRLRRADPLLGGARPRRRLPRSLPRYGRRRRHGHARPERAAVGVARAPRALGGLRQAARVAGRARPDLVPARVPLHALLPDARRPPRSRRRGSGDRRCRRARRGRAGLVERRREARSWPVTWATTSARRSGEAAARLGRAAARSGWSTGCGAPSSPPRAPDCSCAVSSRPLLAGMRSQPSLPGARRPSV